MKTLTRLWRVSSATAGEPFFSTPLFVPDFKNTWFGPGPVIIVQSWDWSLYVIDAITGSVQLQVVGGAPKYGRANYFVDGTNVYLLTSGNDGRITAYDEDGNQRWEHLNVFEREGNYPNGAAATGAPFGSEWGLEDTTKNWADDSFTDIHNVGDVLEILDGVGGNVVQERTITSVENGTQIWVDWPFDPIITAGDIYRVRPRFESNMIFQHVGEIAVEGGVPYLYQTGFDNQVTKINVTTGALVWSYSTQQDIEPWPRVHDFGSPWGRVVISPSVDQKIHFIDAETGAGIQTIEGFGVTKAGFDSIIQINPLAGPGEPDWIHTGGRDGRVYFIRPSPNYPITGTGDRFVLFARSSILDALAGHQVNSSQSAIENDDGTMDVFCSNRPGWIGRLNRFGEWVWREAVAPSMFNATSKVVDINYDGEPEVLFFDMAGGIHVYTPDGEKIGMFFEHGGIEGIPIIEDIDGDGQIEIVTPSMDGWITCYRVEK